jgi:exodeoxyribonuclease VII small subunit
MKDDLEELQALSFEDAFRELEELVQRMEAGNLPLEETLRLFERGNLLARYCQSLLDKAELRVQQIREDEEGATRIESFDIED